MNNFDILKEKSDPQISKILDGLLGILLSLNFSQDEAEKQIGELGKLISMSALKRLSDSNPEILDAKGDDMQELIKAKYSNEELNKIFQEESGKIISEYFAAITEGSDENKKQKVKDGLSKIFE